jgi:hypothetical protein
LARRRRFHLLAAVLVAGCGGGGGGTSTTEETIVAGELLKDQEAKAQRHHHEKKNTIKQERLEQKDNEKFLKEEEDRILRKEAAAERSKHRHKLTREKESKPETKPALDGVAPITAEEFHGFTSEPDHGNWEIAYGICAVTSDKQLAREFHTEQNFGAIGHAYGSEYREPFNIAAEEGCMAALVDSKAQREGAFKMMEDDE